MFDKIIDFIKERYKKLYLFSMIMIILISVYGNLKLLNEVRLVLFDTIKLILPHVLSLTFIFMLILGKVLLFRYSDKKSNKEIEEHEKIFSVESGNDNWIKFKITEGIKSYDNHKEKHKVQIINHKNSTINYIKGFVSFYRDNTRIKKIPFETKNLKENYSEIIYYDFFESHAKFYDYFDAFLDEIIIDNTHECGINISGKCILRSYDMVYNFHRYYDYKFLGLRTKYNLAWLKEELRWKIIPRIKFFYAQKTFSFSKRPWYIELKDFFSRFIRFIIILLLGILLFILSALILIDIINMFIAIFELWRANFTHIYGLI